MSDLYNEYCSYMTDKLVKEIEKRSININEFPIIDVNSFIEDTKDENIDSMVDFDISYQGEKIRFKYTGRLRYYERIIELQNYYINKYENEINEINKKNTELELKLNRNTKKKEASSKGVETREKNTREKWETVNLPAVVNFLLDNKDKIAEMNQSQIGTALNKAWENEGSKESKKPDQHLRRLIDHAIKAWRAAKDSSGK